MAGKKKGRLPLFDPLSRHLKNKFKLFKVGTKRIQNKRVGLYFGGGGAVQTGLAEERKQFLWGGERMAIKREKRHVDIGERGSFAYMQQEQPLTHT